MQVSNVREEKKSIDFIGEGCVKKHLRTFVTGRVTPSVQRTVRSNRIFDCSPSKARVNDRRRFFCLDRPTLVFFAGFVFF